MAAFEILVNGERRFVGEDVTAITLAADSVARRNAERVSLHVGVGEPEDRQVHYLGADLGPGDKITIRVMPNDEVSDSSDDAPDRCSFCGSGIHSVRSLVAGPQVAMCDSCVAVFHGVLSRGDPLPIGAAIQEHGEASCGFCSKMLPDVPGLLVRNAAAVCPECLRTCVEITTGPVT